LEPVVNRVVEVRVGKIGGVRISKANVSIFSINKED
jgi:hypothetical protein